MPARRTISRLLVLLIPLLVLAVGTQPAHARVAHPRPLPKAWMLVDVDTGRVLNERDDHVLRRPASVVKLLTVLTAERLLPNDAGIQVSAHAASMPASKIGLKAGDRWPLEDILDSVLVVSANDAAVALAENASGSVERFGREMERTARDLGAVDAPTFGDPAGLDDQFSAGGGDWVSAWDMAVIGIAALHDPLIAARTSSPVVRFTDPQGHAHRLFSHNRLLTSYPGANGLKTGYTRSAGNTLVASATRDGRTMLVVVFDAPDLYGPVRLLLDKGFETPVSAETGPWLSGHAQRSPPPPTTTTVTAVSHALHLARRSTSSSLNRSEAAWLLLAVAVIGSGTFKVRRRRRSLA